MCEFLEKWKKWMLVCIVGCIGAFTLRAIFGGLIYSGWISLYSLLWAILVPAAVVALAFAAVALVLFVIWLFIDKPKPLKPLVQILLIAGAVYLISLASGYGLW